MTTTTVEGLKEKQAALKARALELRHQFQAEAGDKKKQQRISEDLRATTAELLGLGPQLAAVKEQTKQEALDDLLGAADYRIAASRAADALAAQLEPWLDLIGKTTEARKVGVKAPGLPPIVETLYVDGVGWLRTAVRRGSLSASTLPAALRALVVKEEGQ